ncbi:hypothetical protein [Levilactobacillus senmaizukei]|uniref:hypothetical protein n=2 Tax=Levilactobacillus senmaizukei TaxID=431273 RepID=UPI0012E7A93C|nr:hypothetical protein [Levilactobacillus senmaizukei]
MKKNQQRFIAGSMILALGMVSLVPATAHASTYSAKRSHSVRLVWRRSMKKHSYHGTKGYLYSKHLGRRYKALKAYPHTTWKTMGHEKLRIKKNGEYRIYYHVKSANGKHSGWVWRGHLKKGRATQVIYNMKISDKDSYLEENDLNPTPSAAKINQAFIKIVNAARLAKGVSPLQNNEIIQTQVSDQRIKQIPTNFTHYDTDGVAYQTALFKAVGLQNASHGEVMDTRNWAQSDTATAKMIAYDFQHDGNDGAHWEVITSGTYVYYGLATVNKNGKLYTVMNLMSEPND